MRFTAPVCAVLLALIAAPVYATPWFTQDPRTLRAGDWRVEFHALSAKFEEGVADDHDVPLPGGVRDATSLTLHTRVRYGARNNITLLADFPYVEKEVTALDGHNTGNNAFGDLMFLGKYRYHQNLKERSRRAISVFIKPSTGDYENLTGLLATGSGQTNIGITHLWEQGYGDTTFYASVGYVYTGNRRDTPTNPGDLITVNVATENKLGSSPFNFVMELNGQYQGKSTQNGQVVSTSGSRTLYGSPGIQYQRQGKDGRLLTLEAGVQMPMLHDGYMPAIADHQFYVGGYAIF